MKFAGFRRLFFVAAAVLLLSGCATPLLPTGKFEARLNGRDDYAIVYKDYIFLHIKTPPLITDKYAYWEWGGTYSIGDDGEILFDMTREESRDWRFNYLFYRQSRLSSRVISKRRAGIGGSTISSTGSRMESGSMI